MTVQEARKVISDAFEADPDFMETYVANVAMLLHDRHGIANHKRRNIIASEVIDLIFFDKR